MTLAATLATYIAKIY